MPDFSSVSVRIFIFSFFSWITFIYGFFFSIVLDGETKTPYWLYGVAAAFFMSTLAVMLKLLVCIAKDLHVADSKLGDVTKHLREIHVKLDEVKKDVDQTFTVFLKGEFDIDVKLKIVTNDMDEIRRRLKGIEYHLENRS